MRTFQKLMAAIALGLGVGCGSPQPKGPTYNEALQTYVNEMAIAERLMDARDHASDEVVKKELSEKVDIQLRQIDAAKKVVDELRKSR